MLKTYAIHGGCLVRRDDGPAEGARDLVWMDLFAPTPEEDRAVEAIMGVSIPTRDEMQEIETSSRLYVEDGAIYMTATVICRSDTDQPGTTPVTFILAGNRLATVRYDEPRPFSFYEARASKPNSDVTDGRSVLLGLLDAIVDRVADVLERIAAELDQVSSQVFGDAIHRRGNKGIDYARVIRVIGRQGNLVGKIQDGVVSLSRLALFLGEEGERAGLSKDARSHLKTLLQDLKSIHEYSVSLDSKANFLLEATLGLVGLQQNTIVKIFSVLAVVFMPPTLIASIYGMNFHHMPELDKPWGYPFALGLMFLSVVLTYTIFKWREWL